MIFKIFWAYTKIEVQKSFTYLGNTVSTIVQFLFIILIQISLFQALPTEIIFGNTYSKSEILTYVAGYWIVRELITVWIDYDMARMIHSGKLIGRMCRPVSLDVQFIAIHLGQKLQKLVISIVLFILCPHLFGLEVSFAPSSILLLIIVCLMSFYVAACFSYLFAQLAFLSENASKLAYPKMLAISLLGGGFFPITIFPDWAQSILKWLPFYYIYSLPLNTISGKQSFDFALLNQCVICILWGLVLHSLARRVHSVVQNKIIVLGG